MTTPSSLDKIRALYSSNIEQNGPTSTAVGWNTADSQELRFRKLTEVVDRDSSQTGVTVNDYGCGYGAHLDYLLRNGIRVTEYHGYDLSNEMLAAAREQQQAFPGVLDLRQSSAITSAADYTFVSGTFNVRFDATENEWKSFILTRLNEINAHSRLGFSFNLLSTYVDWKESHLYYADPLFWFDYCKRNFSRKVSLFHDYPLYEWTIIVRK